MNKPALKAYAPQARADFITAITARAAQLGISQAKDSLIIQPATLSGQVMMIDGIPFPASLAAQRNQLIARMQAQGFSATVEAVAYSWFNRLAALRYMELHDDYLPHGVRVLSSVTGNPQPDILNHAISLAEQGALTGLKLNQVVELKTAGNKDNELYKLLLIAQCNALHTAMPLLFERIDDDTELLLPDNLLRTDSIISKLVNTLAESDWEQVEVIGWLYQFYISEKKDAVIGKVVKSEDIPAATQLFTPNWIVKYLVQNSLGRLWHQANPQTGLIAQWEYFIPPAEQAPEVSAQLEALILARIGEDGDTLNPESLTVLDPACGSGHILVEAYDLLKAIYLERGYRLRDIPRLILEKNLFGLDIDNRAAQLASFALLMKARADDRRLFDNPPQLNIYAMQESAQLDLEQLSNALASEGVSKSQLALLLEPFTQAKTFGSLIQIDPMLANHLSTLLTQFTQASQSHDLFVRQAIQDCLPLVHQAILLAKTYDAVIANPPYMGNKYLNTKLKDYLKEHYKGFEKDLFSAFIIRDLAFAKPHGQLGFMTPFVWMFISSYENLRVKLLNELTITSLIQPEYHAFFDSAFVPICTFVLSREHLSQYKGTYIRLVDFKKAEEQAPKTLEAIKAERQRLGFPV
jgi:hypothetical protein